MYKLRFPCFLLIFILINNYLFPQAIYKWYECPTNTTNTLNAIEGSFAVGNNGTLLKKSNSNSSWEKINSGVTNNLNDIVSTGSTGLFIVGDNGIILRSTNYGTNWIKLNTVITDNILSISYSYKIVSPNVINYLYCVCESGKIYYTTNSGNDWTLSSYSINSKLNSVKLLRSGASLNFNGLICGDNGKILYTTNSGLNWTNTQVNSYAKLYSCDYRDSLNFYAASDSGKIYGTYNGGLNWYYNYYQTNSKINSIKYYTNSHIVFCGDNGYVLSTSNLYNLTLENTQTFTNFKDVDYSSENIFAIGENGKIFMKTLDSLFNYFRPADRNNIRTMVFDDGTFNQGTSNNSPGFEWPKDSNKYAIFTSGLNICAKVNNQLRMSAASYASEYQKGYCSNGFFNTNPSFKIYKVYKNDNNQNYDYLNWYSMIPYGAPYQDVNNNGMFEPSIDIPGVKGADETMFICLTDANPSSHSFSSGFGGGTAPLNAEVHFTLWNYNKGLLKDVNFMKFEIINKSSNNVWDSTFMGFYYDIDLGDALDDYMGCDSSRNLAYTYNADNFDGDINYQNYYYGANPPAVGVVLLQGIKINNTIKKATSIFRVGKSNYYSCEGDPEGDAHGAYKMLKGYKKDGSNWLNPFRNPVSKTNYSFSGDPETNEGWTAFKGRFFNCGDTGTVNITSEYPGDKKLLINTGDNNLKMNPGDTQTIITAQLITRGNNNLNSVTKLKELCDSVQAFYNAGFPVNDSSKIEIPISFALYQNYPNPFNNITKVKYEIPFDTYLEIKIYDINGKEIETLVKGYAKAGKYEKSLRGENYSSGVYFYRLKTDKFSEVKKMVLIK